MYLQKSVSPIIATILLIVVAVVLTTIVLNWGVDFVNRSTQSADDSIDFSCMGVDLRISSCEFVSEDDEIIVIVTNTGKKDYSSNTLFYANLSDSDNNFETFSDIFEGASLSVGESKLVTLDTTGLNYPVTVRINSSICPTADSRATCR